jgi:hypothetical protein
MNSVKSSWPQSRIGLWERRKWKLKADNKHFFSCKVLFVCNKQIKVILARHIISGLAKPLCHTSKELTYQNQSMMFHMYRKHFNFRKVTDIKFVYLCLLLYHFCTDKNPLIDIKSILINNRRHFCVHADADFFCKQR